MSAHLGKTGRNDPCACGSGKKYKHCCMQLASAKARTGLSEIVPIPQALRAARAHHQAGRLHQAEAIYRQILQRQPNHPEVRNNLGLVLQSQGKLDEAVASYREAIKIKPALAELHTNLGSVLHSQGKLDEAVASHREALSLKPDIAAAHTNLGNALREQGKLQEAVASYQEAIKFKPDYAEAHSNLGLAMQGQGRLDEALASHHEAIRLAPDDAIAHNNLGCALYAQGKLDEAVASYRKALSLWPAYGEAHCNLGAVLQDQGNLDEAIASCHAAIKFKPDLADAHYNLHSLLLNHGDMAPSIECMKRAVEINPSNANYRFFLGMLLDYSGDREAATIHFSAVENDEALFRARMDAWRYIKCAHTKLPPITGSPIQAFELGINAASRDGMVLEFGVRFGASIRQIAAIANQEAHGFDSFQGLPEAWHHEPEGSYSTKGVIPHVPDNVTLHAGWFEETLPVFLQQYAGPVRFMNIDCDLYRSTRTILRFLSKRIVPGTVIVFDEYIGYEHWREDEFKAFQEAVAENGWDYEYLCFSFFTKQAAIRIK